MSIGAPRTRSAAGSGPWRRPGEGAAGDGPLPHGPGAGRDWKGSVPQTPAPSGSLVPGLGSGSVERLPTVERTVMCGASARPQAFIKSALGDNRPVPSPESVRRRQSGVLVVGAVEPEVTPWLRAAGHAPRAVRDAAAALAVLEDQPADLVIVDREPAGMDAAGVCRALRDGVELSDPWLLAITVPAKGRGADSALDAGADDYLHRPFTRGELLARARAGVRAAQQRADDMLVRALLVNVPGAIYRSAWHGGHSLELISDEIERISGYPPVDFVASAKRTLMSIVHPRDRKRITRAVASAGADH